MADLDGLYIVFALSQGVRYTVAPFASAVFDPWLLIVVVVSSSMSTFGELLEPGDCGQGAVAVGRRGAASVVWGCVSGVAVCCICPARTREEERIIARCTELVLPWIRAATRRVLCWYVMLPPMSPNFSNCEQRSTRRSIIATVDDAGPSPVQDEGYQAPRRDTYFFRPSHPSRKNP